MALTIKQARLLAEMTQQEVADRMGIHRHTYMKWEQNPDEMPIGRAKQFCEIVGVSIDEIFFGIKSTLSRNKAG